MTEQQQIVDHTEDHEVLDSWSFFHRNALRESHLNEQNFVYGGLTCPECIEDAREEEQQIVDHTEDHETIEYGHYPADGDTGEACETTHYATGVSHDCQDNLTETS